MITIELTQFLEFLPICLVHPPLSQEGAFLPAVSLCGYTWGPSLPPTHLTQTPGKGGFGWVRGCDPEKVRSNFSETMKQYLSYSNIIGNRHPASTVLSIRRAL